MSRRLAAFALLLFVVTGSAWWGIHPPRTLDSFRARSVLTARSLHSQVASTVLWLHAVEDNEVLRTTALVAVEEAETDATTQTTTYAAWQPPDANSRHIRSQVATLADEVVNTLGRARVAARDGRWAAAVAMSAELTELDHRLANLQTELQNGARV